MVGGLIMKKYLIILLAASAAVLSCGKENLTAEQEETQPVTFNLTAKHPATKAVKTAWESGDAIFVFFSGIETPKHLKMTYDGTKWTSTEYDGAYISEGALGLKNGDEGTMRAVFLPFGSNAKVSSSGTGFTFDKTYYTYYLTATLDYTVVDNKVSGAFNMKVPEGYVQFFIEDAEATDEAYILGCDAVIPTGIASIGANGAIAETADKTYIDDMPGYAYSGGYLFSGKLNGSYAYSGNYYFAKTKTADNTRSDYFVSGKTLASHSAIKLPSNDNDRWESVGNKITANLGSSLGTWYTCNYGASVPEDIGTKLDWNQADQISDMGSAVLPSLVMFEGLFSSSADRTWISIHGKEGLVVKEKFGSGFLFLPKIDDDVNVYWSLNDLDEDNAYCLVFNSTGSGWENTFLKDDHQAVRFLRLN